MKQDTVGLQALAKKYPTAENVGFLWKNPLKPKSRGKRWTKSDLALFRKFQKTFRKPKSH